MRPTVEQLHHSGRYQLIESFPIDEMMTFILRELGLTPASGQRTQKSRLRMVLMGILGGFVGYFGSLWLINRVGAGETLSALGQLGAGFAVFFLLLPIHEFIHGLAYRRVGAPKVGYGWSLKSLMVFAYSQNFPTTMRELAFVAVMPFLVITAGLLIGWAVWPAYSAFWITLLFVHTSACIGDFALIRYQFKNRRRTIYTYDDVEGERRSYFFEEV